MESQQLFNRSANLLLANNAQGKDLSNLRFRFEIKAMDIETPNIATIRVYNPSEQTVKQALKEYDTVVLQAGYQNTGVIFRGTVKRYRHGKETNVDSFLDIYGADGDIPYNFGFVNGTLPPGATWQDQYNAYADAVGMPKYAASGPPGVAPAPGGVPLPRGKVLFGMWRTYMRDLAGNVGMKWSIDQGQIKLLPIKGQYQSQILKLNSATGMIGVPEATEEGVIITSLLNPIVRVGDKIQVNNKDITQTQVKEIVFPNYKSLPASDFFATVGAGDGLYRVIVIEHTGDTRGQEWYTRMTCLALDPSAG
jgi:hypothetical protein